MYRWQTFALLLLSIGGGVINVTRGNLFQVFSIPLETVDVSGYCDGLESRLKETDSAVILLQVGRPSKAYQIVRGMNRTGAPASQWEFPTNGTACGESNVKDLLVKWIENNEISVTKHTVVEHITLLADGGEYLLTLERSGDLEPIAFEPKFGGLSAKDKLLLSLVGGGRVKNVQQLKKPT